MGGTAGAIAGIAGSAISAFGGGGGDGGSIDVDTDAAVSRANAILDQSLDDALQYTEGNTNTAIDTIQDFYMQSRRDAREGFETSQGLLAPYRKASYDALDMYLDTLGQVRPESSFEVGEAMAGAAQKRSLEGQMEELAHRISAQDPDRWGARGAFAGSGGYQSPEQVQQAIDKGDLTPDQAVLHKLRLEAAQKGESNRDPIEFLKYYTQRVPMLYAHGKSSTLNEVKQDGEQYSFDNNMLREVRPLLQQYETLLGEQYSPERYGLAQAFQTGQMSAPKII
jgi:hypothetical protein